MSRETGSLSPEQILLSLSQKITPVERDQVGAPIFRGKVNGNPLEINDYTRETRVALAGRYVKAVVSRSRQISKEGTETQLDQVAARVNHFFKFSKGYLRAIGDYFLQLQEEAPGSSLLRLPITADQLLDMGLSMQIGRKLKAQAMEQLFHHYERRLTAKDYVIDVSTGANLVHHRRMRSVPGTNEAEFVGSTHTAIIRSDGTVDAVRFTTDVLEGERHAPLIFISRGVFIEPSYLTANPARLPQHFEHLFDVPAAGQMTMNNAGLEIPRLEDVVDLEVLFNNAVSQQRKRPNGSPTH